jgi:hypothetical protein
MSMRAGAQIRDRARQFARDRRGVAALEFALIVPLLLCLYFVTMEVAQAIETNKKVGRVGSMVADLVAQMQEIPVSELEGIMRIGEATMQPYNRSKVDITVTAIEVTDEASQGASRLVAQARQRGARRGSGERSPHHRPSPRAQDQGQLPDPRRKLAFLPASPHLDGSVGDHQKPARIGLDLRQHPDEGNLLSPSAPKQHHPLHGLLLTRRLFSLRPRLRKPPNQSERRRIVGLRSGGEAAQMTCLQALVHIRIGFS